jgi:glucose-1-phosphatase
MHAPRVSSGTVGNIELVVFDLGGVLVRITKTWADACASANLHIPPGFDIPEFFKGSQPILQDYDTGKVSTDAVLDEVCRMAPHWTRAQFKTAIDAWIIGVYDGVDGLLSDLKQRGLKIGCLSNTCDPHWLVMTDFTTEFAPLKKLDYLFASHIIGIRKPEEGIYRHVEKTTGISGNKILFFDDKEENIVAAKGCGWHAELIQWDGNPVGQIRKHLKAHL